MINILIATHNPAKKQELKNGFMALVRNNVSTVSLRFLDDLHITNDPEETGSTFEENARLKARYYGDLTGLITLADDGGIVIPALNNEPGIHSKRWLGRDASDEELIQYTLSRLQGKKAKDRMAYFQVCLCLYDPSTRREICEEEKVVGHIAEKISTHATHGFPYRALFVVNAFNTYYDELTKTQHNEVNHRLKALKKIMSAYESTKKNR